MSPNELLITVTAVAVALLAALVWGYVRSRGPVWPLLPEPDRQPLTVEADPRPTTGRHALPAAAALHRPARRRQPVARHGTVDAYQPRHAAIEPAEQTAVAEPTQVLPQVVPAVRAVAHAVPIAYASWYGDPLDALHVGWPAQLDDVDQVLAGLTAYAHSGARALWLRDRHAELTGATR